MSHRDYVSLRDSVQQDLERTGYSFVQAEPRLDKTSSAFTPDVLAWAADADGKLVPWTVVEVKIGSRKKLPPEAALPQLAKSRDILGTVEHYVVLDGDWYQADVGLRKLARVDGPVPPRYGGEGELDDIDLATSLLTAQLWRWAQAGKHHTRGLFEGGLSADVNVDRLVIADHNLSTELSVDGIETSAGTLLPASREVLWEARRRALVSFARRGREAGIYTSHPVIAKVVARLAGTKLNGEVLDPFCGTGSFLWESIDHSLEIGSGLTSATGFDTNDRMVELARSIARAAPIDVNISCADGFDHGLPFRTESFNLTGSPLVNCAVSAPPVGLKLHRSEPYELLDGTSTQEGDLAAVDCLVRRLADGGRAVIQVGQGFAIRLKGQRYRNYLANHYRVAALIGCPPGSVFDATLTSIIMVIEKASPTKTFVAQLGEDWESQLAPGGAALEAALDHINGQGEH